MQICLNIKCPVFLWDFSGTWIFSADFGKIYRCENSWKFFQWEISSSMSTDGQRETDRWSWYSLFAILRKRLWMTQKCSRYRSGVAQRVGRVIALLFHDRGTRSGWVVSSTPRPHFTPPGKNRYPFYRRLGGLQGRSGRAENLVPTGIRYRSVHPIVSRYTDWATRPIFEWHYLY